MREYPLSVYALLALTRLKAIDADAAAALVKSLRKGMRDVPAWSFPARALFGDPGFVRAVELARMGQGRTRAASWRGWGSRRRPRSASGGAARAEDEDLLWITATLLDRGGVWSASHSLPRYGVTSYRLEYPSRAGRGEVEARLPARVPGAGRQESQGQPGARGAAARDHARGERVFAAHRIVRERHRADADDGADGQAVRRKGAPVTRDVLMDPAKNLELGSRFLGFLWKNFDAAAPLTIAGYNAGEGAVEKWLGERGDLAMDEFMETHPLRRDPQLHQARARLVLRVLVAVRRAARPHAAAGRAPAPKRSRRHDKEAVRATHASTRAAARRDRASTRVTSSSCREKPARSGLTRRPPASA